MVKKALMGVLQPSPTARVIQGYTMLLYSLLLLTTIIGGGAKECLPGQTLVNSSCWWCLMKNHALYGDNLLERPIVIGSEKSEGSHKMAWYECRKKCGDTNKCAFWTFDRTQNTCYLKFGQGSFVFESDDYVSGTKHCKPFLARDKKDVFPVVGLRNEDGETLTVLAAPASFGPDFSAASASGMAFRISEPDTFGCGINSDSHLNNVSTVARPDVSTEVAFVDRGNCAFVTKALFLQSQGFKAAVILDTQLIRSKLVPPIARITAPKDSDADKVQIPVAFVRTAEALLIRRFIRRSKAVVVDIKGSTDKSSWLKSRVSSSFLDSNVGSPAILSSMSNWVASTYSPLSVLILFVVTAMAAVISLTCITYVLLSWRKIRSRRRSRVDAHTDAHTDGNTEGNMEGNMASTMEVNNEMNKEVVFSCSEGFERDPSEEAEVLLECPVCLETSWPPKRIFQCLKGHTICEECVNHPQLKQCPVCRQDLSAKHLGRNLALEKLARALHHAKHARDKSSWSPTAPPLMTNDNQMKVFSNTDNDNDLENDASVATEPSVLTASTSSPALLTVHLPPSP